MGKLVQLCSATALDQDCFWVSKYKGRSKTKFGPSDSQYESLRSGKNQKFLTIVVRKRVLLLIYRIIIQKHWLSAALSLKVIQMNGTMKFGEMVSGKIE